MSDVIAQADAEFHDLLARAQAGCPVAAQLFFNKYASMLLHAIRRRLKRSPEVRTVWDSDDFMQRTRAKLFKIDFDQKHFENPQALLAYLTRTAKNEVGQEGRKLSRQAKMAGFEGQAVKKVSADTLGEIADKAPDPAAEVETEELWQTVLDSFPPTGGKVAVLLRDGYTHDEIAKELNICDRIVRRVVAELKEKLSYPWKKRKRGVAAISPWARLCPWGRRTSG
jgi:RNA polymerase sigma factor (sigma-70 family)